MASRRGQMLDGVLLLDKPEGLSSNHALQRAKRTVDARKAGHTGTLDPFATGLLICCFGRATKISAAMLEADKIYEATLPFGEETDSGDLTGHVTARAPEDFSAVTPEALEAALAAFRGEIEQIPPMVSALKRDGKPLYEYARQGIELERPPRRITIHALDLLACDGRTARVRVHCSKGTYVRTLAQDIGQDRDAALALDIARIHDPLGHLLVVAEGAGLPQQLVDKRGLAMVHVGDDGHVAQSSFHRMFSSVETLAGRRPSGKACKGVSAVAGDSMACWASSPPARSIGNGPAGVRRRSIRSSWHGPPGPWMHAPPICSRPAS